MKRLPEIPTSWMVLGLMAGLIAMRSFGIDTWTTAALSTLMGYLTGIKMEQGRKER